MLPCKMEWVKYNSVEWVASCWNAAATIDVTRLKLKMYTMSFFLHGIVVSFVLTVVCEILWNKHDEKDDDLCWENWKTTKAAAVWFIDQTNRQSPICVHRPAIWRLKHAEKRNNSTVRAQWSELRTQWVKWSLTLGRLKSLSTIWEFLKSWKKIPKSF